MLIELVFLRGCQCTGKSSYLKKQLDGLEFKFNDGTFESSVSKDQIRYELQGPGSYINTNLEKLVIDKVFVARVIDKINYARKAGVANVKIYIDNMNLSQDSIDLLEKTVKTLNYGDVKCAEVFMPLPSIKELLERNNKRKLETGKFIPEKAIAVCYQKYKELLKSRDDTKHLLHI